MEGEILAVNFLPGVLQRLLPAAAPVLLTAVGYVDPGKWAAAVEGGAHFGFDLVVLVLLFNFAAILCQYLSAQISIVTGRDLVQICHDEYDKSTCICLGVQAELSLIALDLTMILGIAHGLNVIFGLDLFTCVSLTTIGAVLIPLFATFLRNRMAKFLCISMAGFIMLFYFLGVLISQPENPLSMNGMITKLSGESAFTLMSLLGASILPHNFYVHSYFAQEYQGLSNGSKDALCHDHFFAILCVFSGIFLVNYVLMNSAANVFHSTGLLLLPFEDVSSLMFQVFRSPIAHFWSLLVLLMSNQLIASTWNIVGRIMLHEFLSVDIPIWLHHATIRLLAFSPALYCVWSSGAEGVYQLLLFTQVMVALLLPSAVIPLFRIASSRSIMGLYKISPYVEFLALITFIGILGLKLIFVVEMVFGNSDWAGNLRWNMSNSIPVPYVVLLIIAGTSACLMLWLLATPLKSESTRIDAETLNLDMQNVDSSIAREVDDSHERIYDRETVQQPESSGRSVAGPSNIAMVQLPETILEQNPQLNTIEVNLNGATFSASIQCHSEELAEESIQASTITKEISDSDSLDTSSLKSESVDLLEKTVGIGRELHIVKNDAGDNWGTEEESKSIYVSSPSLPSEGAGQSRSLSGKSDDLGNAAGSLSRLAGLGRATRRQLASVLEDFWCQLFDRHGQPTQDAKANKLDLLLGVDSKLAFKVDTSKRELPEYFPSIGGRASDSLIDSSLYDFPRQQRFQSTAESSYVVQRGSLSFSLGSSRMQLLDAYAQNSSPSALDSGEKPYSSWRLPHSSDSWDFQPATVHGYQMASYHNRNVRDRSSDYLNSQMVSSLPKYTSLGTTNYMDSAAFGLGKTLPNGPSSVQAPGFQNIAVSRNTQQKSEIPYCSTCSSGPSDCVVCPSNSKKYHSLPDISGFSVPLREAYLANRSAKWDSPLGYGSSVGQSASQQPLYSVPGSRVRTSLAFDELSSSKVYGGALPLQLSTSSDTGSLWSRQPFEHFGVVSRTRAVGAEGAESNPSTIPHESTSALDYQVKLLQSFRYCIVKLIKLEGSDWLFRQNDGADEDLIHRVVAREKFLYESEPREINQVVHMGELPLLSSDEKSSSSLKNYDTVLAKYLASSLPHCGEGCSWRMDLIISFGVWCIRRVLELSLLESRPELWGKYTYVLNHLQGIIELAFAKPRTPRPPCFCFPASSVDQQMSSPPMSNGFLPQASKSGRGKCTTASYLLDVIKEVENAISCRKGRQGTAAGDKAFPKGKENIGSVLKRYKRRLSGKQVGINEGGLPGRRASHGL